MNNKVELMRELDDALCCISELEDYIIALTKSDKEEVSVTEVKAKFSEVFKEYTNE